MGAGTSDNLAHSFAISQQHTINPAHGSRQKSKTAAPHEKCRKDEIGKYIPTRLPKFPVKSAKHFSGNAEPRTWLFGPPRDGALSPFSGHGIKTH